MVEQRRRLDGLTYKRALEQLALRARAELSRLNIRWTRQC
jgi:hypothetical protein